MQVSTISACISGPNYFLLIKICNAVQYTLQFKIIYGSFVH